MSRSIIHVCSTTDSEDEAAIIVHVPPCDSKQCQTRLSYLVATLWTRGIQCFYNYKLNGLYKTQFESYMKEARFTILHKCPVFWRKIRSFCYTLQDVASVQKLMVVSLGTDTIQAATEDYAKRQYSDANTNLDYEHFFELFCVSDISDDESLVYFADKMEDVSPYCSYITPKVHAADGSLYERYPRKKNCLPPQHAVSHYGQTTKQALFTAAKMAPTPQLEIQDMVQKVTPTLYMYKRAVGHTFQEHVCPKLPVEVIQKINQGDIKHILPYVEIMDHRDKTVIDYTIPAQNVACLMDIVQKRTFADRLEEYIELLEQIAQIMLQLHKKDLSLSHIEKYHLYLAQQKGERKMHIVSLANLDTIQPSVKSKKEHNVQHLLDRDAPEGRRDRFLTTASDVYNFGNLMLEILSELVARDLPFAKDAPFVDKLSKLRKQTKDAIVLSTCDLIESCMQRDMTRRPPMARVVTRFKRLFPESRLSLNNGYSKTASNANPSTQAEGQPQTTVEESDDRIYPVVEYWTITETIPVSERVSRDRSKANPPKYSVPHHPDTFHSGGSTEMQKCSPFAPQAKTKTLPKFHNRPLPRIPHENNKKEEVNENKPRQDSKPELKPRPITQSSSVGEYENLKLRPPPLPKRNTLNCLGNEKYPYQQPEPWRHPQLHEQQELPTKLCFHQQSSLFTQPDSATQVKELYCNSMRLGMDNNDMAPFQPDSVTQDKQLYCCSMSYCSDGNLVPFQPNSVNQAKQFYRSTVKQTDDDRTVVKVPDQPDSITQLKQLYRSSVPQRDNEKVVVTVSPPDKLPLDGRKIYMSSKRNVNHQVTNQL